MLAKVLVAKMPVNASVHQPMGLLHGGASALAESGKCGLSFLLIKEQEVRGIEISANHLKYSEGVVTGLHELYTKEERFIWEIKLPMKKEFDFALQVD
jgi:uncharacterized protein (TIGR00369 family)